MPSALSVRARSYLRQAIADKQSADEIADGYDSMAAELGGALIVTSVTLGDSQQIKFGDASDITMAWDGTDFDILQATANSSIKLGIDGAGIDLVLYGDTASATCTWDQSADELVFGGAAILDVPAGQFQLSNVAVTATAAELNHVDDSVMVMTKGAGITGAGVVYKTHVHALGNLIYTKIFVDLTDLTSGGTALDIVGGAGGAASSHFGQVTTALNGTIVAAYIDWIETPAGGGDDIDIYAATESTGAEDAGITSLDETLLLNSGAATAGQRKIFTALPAANKYLYLAEVAGTNAAYTAGIFELTLIGTV